MCSHFIDTACVIQITSSVLFSSSGNDIGFINSAASTGNAILALISLGEKWESDEVENKSESVFQSETKGFNMTCLECLFL